jgi:hypothetical protein
VRKFILFLTVIAFVGGFVFICDDAFAWRKKQTGAEATKTQGRDKAAMQEEITQAAAVPEQPIVCRFKDDQDMEEFEQLYTSKQATFGRIGVLQAYFSMEQNNLEEIDRQMKEKFGFQMDSDKMYDLNRDTREIRELGLAPSVQSE